MTTGTLITVEELAGRLDRADLIVVDCRKQLDAPQSGRVAYAQAHVPGARFAELDTDLSDLSKPGLGRHPMPDDAAFSAVLSGWGWTPQHAVVAYDDAGGALAAARLWWMLRLVGAGEAYVLDGGYSAWRAAAKPTTAALPASDPTRIAVHFEGAEMVGFTELENGLADASLRLLDARGAPRYRGEVEPLDHVAGHVPGACNRPFADNLDANGCFKPAARLAEEFAPLIAPFAPASVVHMCGSGVTACHNLLAMEHAGLSGSRVFAPSWSGWLSDPARPVRTGPQP